MDVRLSNLVERLSDSATLAVAEKARRLRAEGVDVVAFGAGEPDFDTPEHIKRAAIEALRAGDTKYPPVSGKDGLRAAICAYTRRHCGLDYQPHEVCVTSGGKDALHLAMLALLNPGDEVVIPVPYWVSYPEQVKLAGGRAVFVEGDRGRGGKLSAEALRAAVTPRTRLLIINSPSNPAGFTYTEGELRQLAEVVAESGAAVFSDEIYHRLCFDDGRAVSFASLPGMFERTVTFNSASKSFAMTGWRLGYACGPAGVIRAMSKLQSQTTNGPASFIQTAMIAALSGDQACVDEMRDAYARRGKLMYEGLNRLPGVTCTRPTGAYYAFADVAGTFERLGVSDAAGFAESLLERAHVAVVPGNAFGWDTHVRLSFATNESAIEEGLRRLAAFLA